MTTQEVAIVDYDDSVFNSNTTSMDEVAEAIRRKKYGKDVREAMARGFELMQGFYERVNEVANELSNLRQLHQNDVSNLKKRLDNLNAYIRNVENQHDTDMRDVNNHLDTIDDQLSQNAEAIKELRSDLTEVNKRLDTIEQAIFGTDTIEITSPSKPDNSDVPMIEISTTDRKDNN